MQEDAFFPSRARVWTQGLGLVETTKAKMCSAGAGGVAQRLRELGALPEDQGLVPSISQSSRTPVSGVRRPLMASMGTAQHADKTLRHIK